MSQVQSKKFVLKETVTEEPTVIIPPTTSFTTVAFSVLKLGNEWVVAEIPVDPVTKETGEWKIHKEDGSKMSCISKFKILVAHSGLLNF